MFKNEVVIPTLLYLFLFLFTGLTYGKILRGKIVRVSDGDTVWIRLNNGNRVKVRIYGIDTPEKFRSGKLFRESERCEVAPERMIKLGKLASKRGKEILDHSKVTIITHGRGYYGRLLGTIIVNGMDYGLEMIREGYSCVYWRSAPPKYIRAMRQAEKERRGLWSIDYSLMKCLCR